MSRIVERVNTGGLMEFNYPRGSRPPRDLKLEEDIREGYEEYNKIKRRNNILKLIVILITISLMIYYILK